MARFLPGRARPGRDVFGVPIGTEHGIEHVGDHTVAHDQREALDQRHAVDDEDRQLGGSTSGRPVRGWMYTTLVPLNAARSTSGPCVESSETDGRRWPGR